MKNKITITEMMNAAKVRIGRGKGFPDNAYCQPQPS